ncbi:MGMT family protein [Chitinimonas sp. PSY-7]|uniref:MGMT family protein n=1 Tax=Chitinimonas sp. PSY-7 TaxID=3459088 RepID=UPI00403FD879
MPIQPLHTCFIATIRRIPPGKVMSYGAVAKSAGLPRHARHVGVALKNLDGEADVPWWRVVNGEGRISARGLDGNNDLQRVLLEAEGVQFDETGRIDMRCFSWNPS